MSGQEKEEAEHGYSSYLIPGKLAIPVRQPWFVLQRAKDQGLEISCALVIYNLDEVLVILLGNHLKLSHQNFRK